ncbi:M61 family metallopeptidase [Thiohalophilus sp.]|uniref:M61 family metallopeptidase n=1 Tax=Thiohalophilus sp. TaxID=3028392 RepID=UPI002ACD4AAC|nr:PDZ domain-containing protein [Thiohalophilus sp.]MDZ7804489.1 PDZ domain-containing protein [Thiohalophilus sp.]
MNQRFPVSYTVTPLSLEAHLFRVQCTIEQPDPAGQRLSMPSWIPGSYMIRDFAKSVVRLRASDDQGHPLTVVKHDKATWEVAACDTPLYIEYEVYAWDLSVRGAHLDTTHAYFNGTTVFVAIEGQTDQPCQVTLQRPEGEAYQNWRVATTLPRRDAPLYDFGRYQAANYDELIDHPVEMGCFDLASFEVAGVAHDIAITGKHRADLPRLCRNLEKICHTHVAMFGELPKMERYLFMVTAVGEGYGGLEHRSSTSLLCSRNDLPLPGQDTITDNYRNFLGLCSHEYFHLWNVKRIKPATFMPYDLSRETPTRQLWAFEGITSYYDELALVRSGVINTESYLQLLGQTATRVWRGAGRFKQSVADSSFDAWSKFYKQDESAPNNIVSYYTKGALIALALDLTLRQYTDDARSLDDLMRRLWQDYGKPGIGVPEGEIERLAAAIAGTDLSDFFTRYVHGTEDPPLQSLLEHTGINFCLRPARNADDKGGNADTQLAEQRTPIWLGARMVNDPLGARLSQVFDNGPAQKAGLSAGDVIIACDNIKVDKNNLETLLADYPPASTVTLHAFRRDELFATPLELEPAPADTVYLTIKTQSSTRQSLARERWLGQNRDTQATSAAINQ